jgi:hypothetical protein
MTNPMHADLIGKHIICRTYSAGVFAGTLAALSDDGKQARLSDARRIWYWAGAASLSELATRGTSDPSNCKFPAPVATVLVTEAIELIPTIAEARASIEGVPVWTK